MTLWRKTIVTARGGFTKMCFTWPRKTVFSTNPAKTRKRMKRPPRIIVLLLGLIDLSSFHGLGFY